ncbi:MAG: amino acid-binding protein [Vicinamibacterales bacterium]
MPVRPELQIRLPNSPGAFAAVSRILADERVTIVALSLDAQGQLRLVVDNHARAAAVLRDHHYNVVEAEAIVVNVSGGPEGLAPALAILRDAGVNIEYAYGSSGRNTTSSIVVGATDPLRAATASGL